MSVELQPEELGFRKPFTSEVTEVLKIINSNSTPVAFKVKTTAPKQYCVRPNSGIIPAASNVEVQVLLQAMKEDPAPDVRCRDKFLVQSAPIDSTDEANVATLWQNIEKTSRSSILEKKIKVHFLPASGATPNGVSHEDKPPAYSSPSNFSSPAPGDSKSSGAASSEKAKSAMVEAAEATGLASAAAAVTNAIPTSQEELKQQLAEARSQISKLTNQLADPQLRQRKVQEATEKVQTVVQQSSESGVPLQIVAGLCLLSFLIAYLFF